MQVLTAAEKLGTPKGNERYRSILKKFCSQRKGDPDVETGADAN